MYRTISTYSAWCSITVKRSQTPLATASRLNSFPTWQHECHVAKFNSFLVKLIYSGVGLGVGVAGRDYLARALAWEPATVRKWIKGGAHPSKQVCLFNLSHQSSCKQPTLLVLAHLRPMFLIISMTQIYISVSVRIRATARE